jgi:predicted kinase
MGSKHPLSLIPVLGSAGSGKTTFSQRLVPELGCVYLNSDIISEAAFPGDRDSPAYLQARPTIYRSLYDLAFANLKLGNSVLIDAPHVGQILDAEWRAWVVSETERLGARLRVILCVTDQDTRRSRLAARGEARDVGRLADWTEFIRNDPFRSPILLPHIEIDTGRDVRGNIALAVDYLRGAHDRVA